MVSNCFYCVFTCPCRHLLAAPRNDVQQFRGRLGLQPCGRLPIAPAEEGFRCCSRGQITARQAGSRNQDSCGCFRTDRFSSCLLSCQVIWTPRGPCSASAASRKQPVLSVCLLLFLFSAPAPFSARAAGRPLHLPLRHVVPRSGCHREAAPKQPQKTAQKAAPKVVLQFHLRSILRRGDGAKEIQTQKSCKNTQSGGFDCFLLHLVLFLYPMLHTLSTEYFLCLFLE